MCFKPSSYCCTLEYSISNSAERKYGDDLEFIRLALSHPFWCSKAKFCLSELVSHCAISQAVRIYANWQAQVKISFKVEKRGTRLYQQWGLSRTSSDRLYYWVMYNESAVANVETVQKYTYFLEQSQVCNFCFRPDSILPESVELDAALLSSEYQNK